MVWYLLLFLPYFSIVLQPFDVIALGQLLNFPLLDILYFFVDIGVVGPLGRRLERIADPSVLFAHEDPVVFPNHVPLASCACAVRVPGLAIVEAAVSSDHLGVLGRIELEHVVLLLVDLESNVVNP